MKPCWPKLCNWLRQDILLASWRQTWRQDLIMPSSVQIDAMSGIAFWRQEASKRSQILYLQSLVQLRQTSRQTFPIISIRIYKFLHLRIKHNELIIPTSKSSENNCWYCNGVYGVIGTVGSDFAQSYREAQAGVTPQKNKGSFAEVRGNWLLE